MNANSFRRISLVALPLLIAPLAATAPENAAAQGILKCTGADGTTIFTDKSCEQFGATLVRDLGFDTPENSAPGQNREPPQTATEEGFVGNGFAINGCARTRGELIAGVRESIARGDVNRLANYYDWNGMGSSAAFAVMDRLEKMVLNTAANASYDYQPTYDSASDYASYHASYTTARDETSTDLLAQRAYAAATGQVVYREGPSTFDAYRSENADVAAYGSGIVDASTPLSEAKPSIATAPATSSSMPAYAGAMPGGTVDASTPLAEARMSTTASYSGGYGGTHDGYSSYNPRPTAMRVSYGGGSGARYALRERAGCWFIAG